MKVTLLDTDITKHQADVIVNSSNKYLQLGSGVCGAIFRGAGKGLSEECSIIMQDKKSLPIHSTVLTNAHDLPATHILHVVTPKRHEDNLKKSYQNIANELSKLNNIKSVSIPLLGTGVYGHSVEDSLNAFKQAFENLKINKVFLFSTKTDEILSLIG